MHAWSPDLHTWPPDLHIVSKAVGSRYRVVPSIQQRKHTTYYLLLRTTYYLLLTTYYLHVLVVPCIQQRELRTLVADIKGRVHQHAYGRRAELVCA